VSLRGDGTALSFSVLPAELTRTLWWRVRKRLEREFSSLGRIVPIGGRDAGDGIVRQPDSAPFTIQDIETGLTPTIVPRECPHA
jgi:hypothetical protein